MWRPALKRAGLDGLGYRFHDLRHSTASRLIAQGGSGNDKLYGNGGRDRLYGRAGNDYLYRRVLIEGQ